MKKLVSKAVVESFIIVADRNDTEYSFTLGSALRAFKAIKLAEKQQAVEYMFYTADKYGNKVESKDVNWAKPKHSEALKRCKAELKPFSKSFTLAVKAEGFSVDSVMENYFPVFEDGKELVDLNNLAVSDYLISDDTLKLMGYNSFSLFLHDAMVFYVVYNKMLKQKIGESGDYGYRLFKKEQCGLPLAVTFFPECEKEMVRV